MITRRIKVSENGDTSEEVKEDKDFFVKVTVKIGQDLIEQDLNEALYIPMADKLTLPHVLKMLAENPVIHARWNIIYNEAVCEYDVLKTKFDVWYSKKSSEYRKELAKIEKGRVTDKMVEEMIQADPEYTKMCDDLAHSKKNMKHIFAIANGLGEKGDKIVNISSMLKWEADALGGNKFLGARKTYNHIERGFEKNGEKKGENFDLNVNDGWPT